MGYCITISAVPAGFATALQRADVNGHCTIACHRRLLPPLLLLLLQCPFSPLAIRTFVQHVVTHGVITGVIAGVIALALVITGVIAGVIGLVICWW
jgi:hypothetical protein